MPAVQPALGEVLFFYLAKPKRSSRPKAELSQYAYRTRLAGSSWTTRILLFFGFEYGGNLCIVFFLLIILLLLLLLGSSAACLQGGVPI